MTKWLVGLICVCPMFMTGNMDSVSWWLSTIFMTTMGLLIWDGDK